MLANDSKTITNTILVREAPVYPSIPTEDPVQGNNITSSLASYHNHSVLNRPLRRLRSTSGRRLIQREGLLRESLSFPFCFLVTDSCPAMSSMISAIVTGS